MPGICTAIRQAADNASMPIPSPGDADANSMLNSILKDWARLAAPKPMIVLFDEADVLERATMRVLDNKCTDTVAVSHIQEARLLAREITFEVGLLL